MDNAIGTPTNCIVFGTCPAYACMAAAYLVILNRPSTIALERTDAFIPARMKQAIHVGFTRLTEDIGHT